jgi:hypothetical protein
MTGVGFRVPGARLQTKASKVQGVESKVMDKEEQCLEEIICVYVVAFDAKTL